MEKYYLGIDVGKYEHQATLINEQKEIIGQSVRFKNNSASFEDLLGQIKKFLPIKTEISEVKAGMESTGHYWVNLNYFLESSGLKDIEIVNPIETQLISKTRIRKVKNDKMDSFEIAKIISQRNRPVFKNSQAIGSLKKITRFYDKMKRQEKFIKREINSLLELICPEFEGLFNNMFLRTPLAILNNFSDLGRIDDIGEQSFCELLSGESRGRIKKDRALKIMAAIKNSIGRGHWDDCSAMQVKMLLDNLDMLSRQIGELKSQIEKLSDQLEEKKWLVSIPGISSVSAAIYLSELGDVSRFENKHKLTAFAGIDASVFESGNYKRKQGNRISKRGSKYLRKQLYYAAKTAIIFDPEMKKFYQKKKQEGKHYNVIMIAVARKILMRIYIVLKQKRLYEVRS